MEMVRSIDVLLIIIGVKVPFPLIIKTSGLVNNSSNQSAVSLEMMLSFLIHTLLLS